MVTLTVRGILGLRDTFVNRTKLCLSRFSAPQFSVDRRDNPCAAVAGEIALVVKLRLPRNSKFSALAGIVRVCEFEVPKRPVLVHDGLHFLGFGINTRNVPAARSHHLIVVMGDTEAGQVRAMLGG